MPVTSPDSIYYADTTTADSIATITATQATSVQNALNNRAQRTYKWANAAARAAQTGMTEGDIGDQADSNQRYRYDGSTWRNITPGLVPIVPTASAVGGPVTVSTSGALSFGPLVSSVSVNGLASLGFDNIQVIIDQTAASAATAVGWRARTAANVDDSGANYSTRYIYQPTTTTLGTTAPVSQTNGAMVANVGTQHLIRATFAGLTVARATKVAIPESMDWNGSAAVAPWNSVMSSVHDAAVAYDGFTIIFTSGTATGKIWVYGYNQ